MTTRLASPAGKHVPGAVIAVALAASACAAPVARAAPARPVPARAAAPDTSADSLRRMLLAPGGLQRVLARSDSLVRERGGARADEAQLYLSWNAPWGTRRAARTRTPACADSTVEDTLYLSVVTGRAAERFTGFTAQVAVRATGSDTLGAWWHMEGRGGANAGSLRAEWATSPAFGWKQPFRVAGQGFVMLDRTPAAVRLRMVYAVPYEGAAPVAADSVYALVRVIFKHRPERGLAGCGQPVCVEWADATLAFGAKDEPHVRRGERFVGFGGPNAICEPFRGARVEAWKPPTPATKSAPGR
jgi:hypothetical protein